MNLEKIIVFGLLMISIPSVAQKMPEDYFEEGVQAVQNHDDSGAIAAFNYVIKNHPKNELYPRCYYNIGYLYYADNNYAMAKIIFKDLLIKGIDDKESSGRSGIMEDPYANYKHNASTLLSIIYEKTGNLDTALNYLFVSDTQYHYQHFCGNELAQNEVSTALRYSKLYNRLNKIDEAELALLKVAFIHGIASNDEALDSLEALYKRYNKPEELKRKIDYSIENFVTDTSYYYKKDTEYTYYIYYDNEKIDIGYHDYMDRISDPVPNIPNRKKIIEYLKQTDFYVRVQQL